MSYVRSGVHPSIVHTLGTSSSKHISAKPLPAPPPGPLGGLCPPLPKSESSDQQCMTASTQPPSTFAVVAHLIWGFGHLVSPATSLLQHANRSRPPTWRHSLRLADANWSFIIYSVLPSPPFLSGPPTFPRPSGGDGMLRFASQPPTQPGQEGFQARLHIYTYTHTHIYIYTHTHIHIYTRIYTDTDTRTTHHSSKLPLQRHLRVDSKKGT